MQGNPAVTAAVLLAAATLQGFTGFGYSLMAMPLLILFTPARAAAPVLCVTGITLNAILLLTTRKSFDLRGLLPLAVPGVLFTPAGAWLVREAPSGAAGTFVGAVTAVMALALLFGVRGVFRRTAWGMAAAGTASGILNGFSTFSGPPVVLLLTAAGEERDRTRSWLAGYFLLLGIAGAFSYWTMGMLPPGDLPGIAAMLPFTGGGAVLGSYLAGKTDSGRFRRISLAVMAALGLLSAVV